jgi:hypothetical protein
MNYYTDSAALQTQLEDNLDKRNGKSYGPPSGQLVYFVDDMNLPQVEVYIYIYIYICIYICIYIYVHIYIYIFM